MAKSKSKNDTSISTTAELRKVLLETIQGIRSGDIDHRQGASVASLSKAVIASAKLDFEVFRYHKELSLASNDGSTLKAIGLDG